MMNRCISSGDPMPSSVQKSTNSRFPEFFREPLEGAQARLASFEQGAEKVFEGMVLKGKESGKDWAKLVQRLSRPEWKMEELRARMSKLREQSVEHAQVLRGRAESFRTDALERLQRAQYKAVELLGVASREQVEGLARRLDKLSRQMNKVNRTPPPRA